MLLDHGADPDIRLRVDTLAKKGGDTALMYAALMGHIQTVEFLLERGADPHLSVDKQITAADIAAERGYEIIVAILKRAGANVRAGNPGGRKFASSTKDSLDFPNVSARIRKIDWFANCGTRASLSPEDFSFRSIGAIRAVSSWDEARAAMSTIEWENAAIEAQNALTGHLFDTHRAAFSKHWNPTARAAKAFFCNEVDPVLIAQEEALAGRRIEIKGRLDNFLMHVTYDLLGAVQWDANRAFDPPTSFSEDVLAVYEAGHLPCGWEGGEWPQGRLLIW